MIGSIENGIHEWTNKSINRIYESNVREEMYKNIILCGGTTMLDGLTERLHKEMSNLAPTNCKINIVAPSERKYITWLGGSILTSLSSFQDKWITQVRMFQFTSNKNRKCTRRQGQM
jgi:actin